MPPRDAPAGFIFGCTRLTETECRQKKLFGLPARHGHAVQSIEQGTPLFLFNYDLRVLYGVFWAASAGGWGLEPAAWRGQFPAQIYVHGINETPRQGEGLPERVFSNAIVENFFSESRFYYTLNANQVQRLMELYRQEQRGARMTQTPVRGIANSPGRRGGRGRGIVKPQPKTPRHQQRRPRVLKLSPGRPAPELNTSKRHFGRYHGCHVVVDDCHPIAHYRPPGYEHQRCRVQRQSSEDRMEVESVGRTSSNALFASNLPEPVLTPPLMTMPAAVRGEAPVERKATTALVSVPPSIPAVVEEQWALGAVTWADPYEFRGFLYGYGNLPPAAEMPSGIAQRVPHQTLPTITETEENVLVPYQPPVQGGLREIFPYNNQNEQVQESSFAFPPPSPVSPPNTTAIVPVSSGRVVAPATDGFRPPGPPLEVTPEVAEEIIPMFQEIGYSAIFVQVAPEHRVPNSNQQIGVVLYPTQDQNV